MRFCSQAAAKEAEADATAPSAGKQKKLDALKAESKVDPLLEAQFQAGRLYAAISSRPGQSGRCDGYVLEGKELEFYLRRCAFLFSLFPLFDAEFGICL